MNINRRFIRHALALVPVAVGLLVGISACGGGGGGGVAGSTASPAVAAAAGTTSSGVITAFGSVFVGGHEFATGSARFIDDDSGAITLSASGLEVGMVVDVKPASGSSAATPVASELHIHPLARGYVDAADAVAGTLQVMGQSVQLTSSTNFSDHRACVSASPATCTAVSTPAGLTATSTSAGSYVAVHGYLYGSTSAAANIVATLVAVFDAPTATTGVHFKAEGVATVASGAVSIGGLAVDLSKASCKLAGVVSACASAFSTGQVVSVWSALAPALPATTLVADGARLASKTAVDTSSTAVELEGVVSSASGTSFVIRGVSIDASALAAGSTLPAVGDAVRVLGSVAASGQTVAASSVVILHAASSVKLGLEGDASDVASGTAANTFTLSVLGQTITVNAQTRLADMSTGGWDRKDPAANPFNITTFATYLASSASKHVIVKAETDALGNLVANSLAITKASTVAGVAGLVDASPAVSNSTVTGTASTLWVHHTAVVVDPAAVTAPARNGSGLVTMAAGDQVVALGTWNGSTLVVGATVSSTNKVFDAGPPQANNRDRGEF